MNYGINQDILNSLNKIFINYFQISEVILFGSRASNSFKENSDIDLSIKGNFSFDYFLEICSVVNDLQIINKFDIINYNTVINEELIQNINNGIVIYKK